MILKPEKLMSSNVKPFLNLNIGITILFKAPPTVSNMFVFLAPFSLEVWISLLAVTVGIIVSIFILAKWLIYKELDTNESKLMSI